MPYIFYSNPNLIEKLFSNSGITSKIINAYTDSNNVQQSKIYHMRCSHYICEVLILDKELSVPRDSFVAMPIPDHMSGCISESKFVTNFL